MNRRSIALAAAVGILLSGWVVSPAGADPGSTSEPSPIVSLESTPTLESVKNAVVTTDTPGPDSPPTVEASKSVPAVTFSSPVLNPELAAIPAPTWATTIIATKWADLGGLDGKIGAATSAATCQRTPCHQEFVGGTIFAISTSRATVVLRGQGGVGAHWFDNGGMDSELGYPITDEASAGQGSYQEFDLHIGLGTAILTWRPGSGMIPVDMGSVIGQRFVQLGAVPVLGFPTTLAICGLRDGGCKQEFTSGTLLSNKNHLAAFVKGGIKSKWTALSAQNGVLGYPTYEEECSGKVPSCVQSFEYGDIMWSSKTGAAVIRGGIGSAYWTTGFAAGPLGLPLGDEECNLRDKGCMQTFQNGQIAWSSKTSAKTLRGAIGSRYKNVGSQYSFLGYPTTDEACGLPGRGCKQDFQGGTIVWSSASGARVLRGAIKATYIGSYGGWHGPAGLPVTDEICGQPRNGCYQQFQSGRFYWSPVTRTAALVKNGIQSRWNQVGGPGGRMGYPVWNEVCANGYCEQRFQYGVVTWSAPGALPW